MTTLYKSTNFFKIGKINCSTHRPSIPLAKHLGKNIHDDNDPKSFASFENATKKYRKQPATSA